MASKHPLLDELVASTLGYFRREETWLDGERSKPLTLFDATEITIRIWLDENPTRAQELIVELVSSQEKPLVPSAYKGALVLDRIVVWRDMAQMMAGYAVYATIYRVASEVDKAEDARREALRDDQE